MRRLFWLAMGVTIGALVVRKLSSAAEKLTPGGIASSLADALRDLAEAIGDFGADVRAGLAGPVPPGLRDAHYAGAKKLGHGKSYVYPHDHPDGIVPQQYAPDALVGRDYYRPTSRGAEAPIAARLTKLRAILRRSR